MIDKTIANNQAASLQDWKEVADQMQGGEHLRAKSDGAGGTKLYSKSKHGATARPSWMANRRTKFTDAKVQLRDSVVKYFKSQGKGSAVALEMANEVMKSALSGGKRLERSAFFCWGKKNGHSGLQKQDILKVIDAARAKTVGFNSTKELAASVKQEVEQEIRTDDPTHNIPRFDENPQKVAGPVRVVGKHHAETREHVKGLVDKHVKDFAVMVKNGSQQKGAAAGYVMTQLLKDPTAAAMLYQVAKGQASEPNIAFQLELVKLEQLLDSGDVNAANQKADYIFNEYVVPGNPRTVNYGDSQEKRAEVCNRGPNGNSRVQNDARDFLNALRGGDTAAITQRNCSQPFGAFISQFCDKSIWTQVNDAISEIDANSVDLKPPANDPQRPQLQVSIEQQIRNLQIDTNIRVPLEYKPSVLGMINTAQNALALGKIDQAQQAIQMGQQFAKQGAQRAEQVAEAFDNLEAVMLSTQDRSGGAIGAYVSLGREMLEAGDVSNAMRCLQSARQLQSGNMSRQDQLNQFSQTLGSRLANFDISSQRQQQLTQLVNQAKSANVNQDIRPLISEALSIATAAVSEAILADDESSIRDDESIGSLDTYDDPQAGRQRTWSSVSEDIYDDPRVNPSVQQ